MKTDMKKKCIPVCLGMLAVALLCGGQVLAAPPPVPDLTQGGTKDTSHDWTLGPTGARGWIGGWNLETTNARQILITQVEKGSPADGVLEVGDVILGVDGQPFDSDARRRFGRAIRFYVGKGSIPSGDHPPFRDLHDNNGNNSFATVAFDLRSDREATRFFSRMSTASMVLERTIRNNQDRKRPLAGSFWKSGSSFST